MNTLAAMAHRVKPILQNMCIHSLGDDILILENAKNQKITALERSLRKVQDTLNGVVSELIVIP